MMNTAPQAPRNEQSVAASALVIFIKTLLPMIILAAGVGVVVVMMKTAPQPKKASHKRRARLVTVVEAVRKPHQIKVRTLGTVQPAREVTLSPQVSGEIVEISPALEPGGYFGAGDLIVRIEPADYALTMKMREAELTRMDAKRVLEQANQDVAKREYEVLGEALNAEEKALVLREPQLTSALAEVAAAQAMLADARLDMERTRVTAPFDAQVVEKHVELGTRLTTQNPIVRLVGTATYWIALRIPQEDLRWVELPADGHLGSRVILRQPKVWDPEAYREGHVIRLLPELSAEGSMARVLVAIADPLCLDPANQDKPRLLVGQLLMAEIEGTTLDNVVELDRRHLRNGDWAWTMNSENKLEVRSLEIAYRGLDKVLVRAGIEDGEKIVATDISAVAEGMTLRLDGDEREADAGKPARGATKGTAS